MSRSLLAPSRLAISMPGTTIPPVSHYVPAPTTKEERKSSYLVDVLTPSHPFVTVEWADLPIIDLSKASTLKGREALAPQVRDAMRTFGFMYVINHGLTQEQVGCELTPPPRRATDAARVLVERAHL